MEIDFLEHRLCQNISYPLLGYDATLRHHYAIFHLILLFRERNKNLQTHFSFCYSAVCDQ